MIALLIVVVIAVGVVCCVGICCYAKYKENELDYKREQTKTANSVAEIGANIEIAQERTKQLQIKADYREKHDRDMPEMDYELEIAKEKTKQLEIKDKHYRDCKNTLYV